MCFNLSFSQISDQGNANSLPEMINFLTKRFFFKSKMYNFFVHVNVINKQYFSTVF